MKSDQNRADSDDLAVLLVKNEERLLGLLEGSLDADGERIETDERSVAHEVATVEELVVVARTRDVRVTGLVPLCDGLVHGDGQPADTTLVLDGMAVVETNHLAVHRQVGVVALGDDDPHTWVAGIPHREGIVDEELERVPQLRCRAYLVGDPAVVPD